MRGNRWSIKTGVGRWRGCAVGILALSVEMKCPSSLLPEIAGAGGFLQGDQGNLMTPGFPEQNYPNGALYQVEPHT